MAVVLQEVVADFSLPSSDGHFRLRDQLGTVLVLYFYPKDATPGCTREGLDFNSHLAQFKDLNAAVYGISRDTVESHQRFCERQGFAFPLLSDSEELLCKQFDVIKEKTLYGRRHIGIERSTFLLDAEQRLQRVWRRVRVDGHVAAVLEAVQKLAAD